jgi:DNA-directed RNA polymerase subunit L
MSTDDESPPVQKDQIVFEIINYISTLLVPLADASFEKDIYAVLAAAYSTPHQQTTFVGKLSELKTDLAKMGVRTPSEEIMKSVPNGTMKEFYIAPWQLSFDSNLSVKGL